MQRRPSQLASKRFKKEITVQIESRGTFHSQSKNSNAISNKNRDNLRAFTGPSFGARSPSLKNPGSETPVAPLLSNENKLKKTAVV